MEIPRDVRDVDDFGSLAGLHQLVSVGILMRRGEGGSNEIMNNITRFSSQSSQIQPLRNLESDRCFLWPKERQVSPIGFARDRRREEFLKKHEHQLIQSSGLHLLMVPRLSETCWTTFRECMQEWTPAAVTIYHHGSRAARNNYLGLDHCEHTCKQLIINI